MGSVIFVEDEKSQTVMSYNPKKLHVQVSRAAESFVIAQPQAPATSFRLHDLVAQQTGIQDLEKASVERRIEEKALERLQEIQERAYREAYNLGLEEGTKQGYEEAKVIVGQRLSHLNMLIEKITRLKPDILQRNEGQIVDMIFFLASKIARVEIAKDEKRITPVLQQAVESLQKDESMVIKVSPLDMAQIEELRKISDQEFEFINSAKIEAHDSITAGGCLIETNYGLIDATLEERMMKLAAVLEEAKPQSKKDQFE